MELQKVQSSNIDEVGFAAGVLIVKFKNGSKYQYNNVPDEEFKGLIAANSIGSYFNQNIKTKYDCIKMEDGTQEFEKIKPIEVKTVSNECEYFIPLHCFNGTWFTGAMCSSENEASSYLKNFSNADMKKIVVLKLPMIEER